jgi:hypothetical protein
MDRQHIAVLSKSTVNYLKMKRPENCKEGLGNDQVTKKFYTYKCPNNCNNNNNFHLHKSIQQLDN